MRTALTSLLLVLVLAACGGDGGGGREVFARAQSALREVDLLKATLTVKSFVTIHRTATFRRSDLPLAGLHVGQWAKHPRRVACGHGFECAKADLDVERAVRELEPVLPRLPIDPSSVHSATVEVRLDSRGRLRRVEIAGEVTAADVTVDLRPAD